MSENYLKLNYFKKMTMKMVHLWHPLKQVSRPKQKKIGQDTVTLTYNNYVTLTYNKIFFLV